MPDWLVFLDISKVSATEWWAAGRLTTMDHAFLHYKDGTYTVVTAAAKSLDNVTFLGYDLDRENPHHTEGGHHEVYAAFVRGQLAS